MTEEVAIRDTCPLVSLNCFHDADDDGRPACRQGSHPDNTFTTIDRSELPEGVEKCDYCSGAREQSKATANPDVLAYKLEAADPDEVSAR